MKKQYRTKFCCVAILLVSILLSGCGLFGGKETEKPTPKKTTPAATKKPDVKGLIQTGQSQRQDGKLKKALATFKKALKADPNNAEAARYIKETQEEIQQVITKYLNQGIQFFNQDSLKEAIQEWDKVLELDPSHQKALEYKERAEVRLKALEGGK